MKPRLRETTWYSKEYMATGKILPYFGEMNMDEITTIDVIRWQNDLMSQKSSKGKCHSSTYLRAVNNQLTAIFNHAVKYYGLQRSPCTRVEKMGSESTEEMKFWTKEEHLAFAEAIMDKSDSFTAFEILH